ncbi:MAG TPA: hypothetical protein VFH29_10150 [Anaerolineales bacterium]|nr:hypothetical protein [Anaerolineales bacterium]
MPDYLSDRVSSDFSRARLKSFLNRVRSLVSGTPTRLLSYEEVRSRLHVGGPISRGIQTVPVKQIVGSLNRYAEFDRAFKPVDDRLAARWQNVDYAFYKSIGLPPVLLYKVGQVYFVVDGHHRVSVAREQGQEDIEADVRECSTKVNITPDLKAQDLEILGEKVRFLESTRLDQLRPDSRIRLTLPGGFDRMLEHIAVHGYFMGIDLKRDVSQEEAVMDWHDKVYMPIVEVIRSSQILREFPGRTEGDLYVWVLDHQEHLVEEEGQPLESPEEAAREFLDDRDAFGNPLPPKDGAP